MWQNNKTPRRSVFFLSHFGFAKCDKILKQHLKAYFFVTLLSHFAFEKSGIFRFSPLFMSVISYKSFRMNMLEKANIQRDADFN